jgi:hypothetical protein
LYLLVWANYAGLNLKGDVDITEARYLCEKHFSQNYISNQSRRKMLVHTAIPKKHSEDASDEPNFTIFNSTTPKKRKICEYSMQDLQAKHSVKVETNPKTNNFQKRTSSRISKSPTTSNVNEEIEEYNTEVQFETISPSKIVKLDVDPVQQEVFERPQAKVQYYFVKQKVKPAEQIAKMSTTVIRNPRLAHEDGEKSSFNLMVEELMGEEQDITSSLVDFEEEATPVSLPTPPIESLENYSEFIFSGEKYVQMPKRVFEAENEKIRKEAEKYKNLLQIFKNHLNNVAGLD